MAKSKGAPSVQNRHIYTRVSYLYQAASYLASQAQHTQSAPAETSPAGSEDQATSNREAQVKATRNMSRQTLSDMRAVSLKAQIRQSPDLKRTICKFCDSLLIEGATCTSVVENESKGGKKSWADVLVIECKTCGRAKRFPVNAQRQKRRPHRESAFTADQAEVARSDELMADG